MKLFEFEAKDILRKYGLQTPSGSIARDPVEVEIVAKRLGKPVALKAQVLVSGRGKSGGIQFADDAGEAKKAAIYLIGSHIKGNVVRSLLVEEKLSIVDQYYASITIDRQARRYVVLASTNGGVDVEETALTSPNRISRYWVDPATGFNEETAKATVAQFSVNGDHDITEFASVITTLYRVAMDYDAELVEINPLAKTSSGEFIAADARIVLDDNALFRHPEFEDKGSAGMDDNPREAEAKRQKLAYVDLSGDIGIIGNGAGLVMATMDLVHLLGGRAANFLDIGGGAQPEVVRKGLMLVMSKPGVKAVLINILGGITRCDLAARGIIGGLSEVADEKPMAVRLMGTNDEVGREMLRLAGIPVYSDMETAARKVIGWVKR